MFYGISAERRQFQGSLDIQNSHPPSSFRRFDPPYPGLQISALPVMRIVGAFPGIALGPLESQSLVPRVFGFRTWPLGVLI